MKVIFLQDVPNVARAGDIKEVANGYGRNFLVPKNLARSANSPALSIMETQLKIKSQNQEEETARLVKLGQELDGKKITLKARVGAKEHLYGSITNADITAELQNTTGLVVDKKKIELAESIRQLGSYEIDIRLAKDIIPKIKVIVTEKEME